MNDDDPIDLATHIKKHFDGDVWAYQRATIKVARDMLDWKTVLASETYLPEFEKPAHNLIQRRLGYIPRLPVYKSHELFLRHLVNEGVNGRLELDEFYSLVDAQIKHIRNDDMKTSFIALMPEYDQTDFKHYESHLIEFKEMARSKISFLLGYIPELRHSLEAEMYLRGFLSNLSPSQRDGFTWVEYRAATFTKYREVYLKYGEEAADQSPLVGIGWDSDGIDPINQHFSV